MMDNDHIREFKCTECGDSFTVHVKNILVVQSYVHEYAPDHSCQIYLTNSKQSFFPACGYESARDWYISAYASWSKQGEK